MIKSFKVLPFYFWKIISFFLLHKNQTCKMAAKWFNSLDTNSIWKSEIKSTILFDYIIIFVLKLDGFASTSNIHEDLDIINEFVDTHQSDFQLVGNSIKASLKKVELNIQWNELHLQKVRLFCICINKFLHLKYWFSIWQTDYTMVER